MESDSTSYWTRSRRRKRTIFGVLCFSYFCYGKFVGTLGQEFSALLHQTNATETELGYSNSFRSFNYGLFSLIATFSIKRVSRHVHFIVSQFIMFASLLLIPLVSRVGEYWAISALTGIGMAFSDCSTNMWIFELFAENVNFYFQFLYMFYSLGQTFGPIVVLLSQESDSLLYRSNSSVAIPFFLNAFLYFVAFFLVALLYIIQPYVPPKRVSQAGLSSIDLNVQTMAKESNEIKSTDNPLEVTQSNKQMSTRNYIVFVTLANVVLSLNSTNELSALNLLPYFLSKSGIASDETQQNLMGIVTGGAYTVGHALMMFGALKVSPSKLAYVSLFLVTFANALLCISIAPIILHLFALVSLALAFSAAFPAILSFIESRIMISNTVNCIFLASFSYLSAVYSLFVGDLFKNSFFYQLVNLLLSLSVFILFAFLHSFDCWKFKKSRSQT